MLRAVVVAFVDIVKIIVYYEAVLPDCRIFFSSSCCLRMDSTYNNLSFRLLFYIMQLKFIHWKESLKFILLQ